MARQFKADIRRDASCRSCGTNFYYFHSLKIDEYDSEKFDAKVRDAVANSVGVAPCPACGSLNPEMRSAHQKALMGHLIGAGVCLGVLGLAWLMLEQRALFYVLIPVVALALLGYLGAIGVWFFEPKLNRKHSIIPGKEQEASEKARGQLAAWKASQTPF